MKGLDFLALTGKYMMLFSKLNLLIWKIQVAIRQTLCGSGFQPRIQLSRLEAAPTFNTTCSFWITAKFNFKRA